MKVEQRVTCNWLGLGELVRHQTAALLFMYLTLINSMHLQRIQTAVVMICFYVCYDAWYSTTLLCHITVCVCLV